MDVRANIKNYRPLESDGSKLFPAVSEVLVAGAAYLLTTRFFIHAVDFSALMPAGLPAQERAVGGVFLAGIVIQFAFLSALALFSRTMRCAMRGSLQIGNGPAWGVALIAGVIHAATLGFFFIEDSALIFEPSPRNLVLSLVPAVDGWTQEVMFRGYVIYRLARSGASASVQIVISAVLFSTIHIGYAGADVWSFFWPIFGTAVLGGFLAWSVRIGNGALLPAIACHAVLIMIAQPWLAFAR